MCKSDTSTRRGGDAEQKETTNPLLLDLPGSVPSFESGLQGICREQAIDVGKASYLGVLRVKLLTLARV